MSGRIAFSLFGVLAAAGLALLWSFGCDDKPTEPKGAAARDYPVYFVDLHRSDSNWYFTYHPLTNELDSVFLPFELFPVISADGKLMYIRDAQHNNTAILELPSFEIIGDLPYVAPLAVSPDNRLLAVWRNGLCVINTDDYSEIFSDTSLSGGEFSFNSQRIYGFTKQGSAYKLDLADSLFPVTVKSFPGNLVRSVVTPPDESRWYVYLATSHVFLFLVYDVGCDSVVFVDDFYPGQGEMAITPDGRYVFYTNPGGMPYSPGPPWITVYDAESNNFSNLIITVGALPEPYEEGVAVGELCITPDGRWLVAIHTDFRYILTIDTKTQKPVRGRLFGGYRHHQGLACQNGL